MLFSWADGEEPYDCHRFAMEGYLKNHYFTYFFGDCLFDSPFYTDTGNFFEVPYSYFFI